MNLPFCVHRWLHSLSLLEPIHEEHRPNRASARQLPDLTDDVYKTRNVFNSKERVRYHGLHTGYPRQIRSA